MRAFLTNRLWVIVLAFVALAALIELAIGLKSMSFREAQPFGQEQARQVGAVSIQLVDSILSVPLQTQLMVWIVFVLIFVLIGLLLSPELRKRLILIAIRVAITYWALYIVFSRYRDVLAQMSLNLTALGGVPDSASNGAPLPVFTPPQISNWLAYVLSFGIAVLLIAALLIYLTWKGYGIWKELNTPHGTSDLKKLAQIARTSLNDLSTGRETTDVILDCYQRMSEVVATKKNLQRKESMTPGEFAARLEGAGLPGEAVRTLTRLFEAVRYGGHQANPGMVNEATACLKTILHYCGEAA